MPSGHVPPRLEAAIRLTQDGDCTTAARRIVAVAEHLTAATEALRDSVAVARRWMLKYESSEHSESSYREERSYVCENPHEHALRRIFDVAGVEYGRVDYSMKDGAPVVWEINLNPVIGRGLRTSTVLSGRLRAQREETKAHFYARFLAAFDAIGGGSGQESVEAPFPADATSAVTRVENPCRFALARKMLRPVRPLIDGVAGAASPILLSASRLLQRRS